MAANDDDLPLNLLRAASDRPELSELLTSSAGRISELSGLADRVADARRCSWPTAEDEAAGKAPEVEWATEHLESALRMCFGELPPARRAPHLPQPREGILTFDEIATRAKFHGDSPWDAYLFDRWSAAVARNADKQSSTFWGPVRYLYGSWPNRSHGGMPHPGFSASIGRQHRERKDVPHRASADEIVAFRRVVHDFSRRAGREAVWLQHHHTVEGGTHTPVDDIAIVEADESNPERSSWSLQLDLWREEPDGPDGSFISANKEWNTALHRFIAKHTLQLADELMDAGVFVHVDMLGWVVPWSEVGDVGKFSRWAAERRSIASGSETND